MKYYRVDFGSDHMYYSSEEYTREDICELIEGKQDCIFGEFVDGKISSFKFKANVKVFDIPENINMDVNDEGEFIDESTEDYLSSLE